MMILSARARVRRQVFRPRADSCRSCGPRSWTNAPLLPGFAPRAFACRSCGPARTDFRRNSGRYECPASMRFPQEQENDNPNDPWHLPQNDGNSSIRRPSAGHRPEWEAATGAMAGVPAGAADRPGSGPSVRGIDRTARPILFRDWRNAVLIACLSLRPWPSATGPGSARFRNRHTASSG